MLMPSASHSCSTASQRSGVNRTVVWCILCAAISAISYTHSPDIVYGIGRPDADSASFPVRRSPPWRTLRCGETTLTIGNAQHFRQRDIVVVGASAGGVEALGALAQQLHPELPAAILVVLHISATGHSVLPDILARSGSMPAAAGRDGDPIRRGQMYVAPNDFHMLIHDGSIALSHGPRENGHRPAIDPLFRSAARLYRDRVIGVVLSGMLDDGAAGLRFIKESGGAAVVQDPQDALYTAMPLAAMDATEVDAVVPVSRIGETLESLIDEQLLSDELPADRGPDRVEIDPTVASIVHGPPTGLTCPECGGALWSSEEEEIVRFVCQVGHAYSAESLIEAQGHSVEGSLWAALRALEERSDLLRRLGRRAQGKTRERFEHRAQDADAHAGRLRDVLMSAGRLAPALDE
jgi:two-component system chemotaxis response regulator CheB